MQILRGEGVRSEVVSSLVSWLQESRQPPAIDQQAFAQGKSCKNLKVMLEGIGK